MAKPELKRLGRYDLTRVLGEGAMGIVYEGLDPRLNRTVAIKTILKGHLDNEAAAKEYSMRFMREAQSVARLNHPHIVQVYDFGEEGEIAYIVMEFIKGKELKNFFDANERFELKEAVRIMCELLDALELAHEGGIVHRDVKPANVMLDSQARVKLADFGVARVTDDRAAAEKTKAGTLVGTPAYMSPEQINGSEVDRRSDIFSAGIILYQFLTGEKPFTGSGAWTIAKKIMKDDPAVPSSIDGSISPLFDHVVNKALSKQADTRYQSAREFSAALTRALEGRGDEDDPEKTVVGSLADLGAIARPSVQSAAAKPEASRSTTSNQEVELEFWRAIKDGNDPDDFNLYVQQFPSGIYAALAKRRIAKLRGVAPEESGATAGEEEEREAKEAARREAEVRQKLAEEKAKLEAQLAAKEAEYAKREAEQEARRLEEAKARAAADARREADMARREAEAKVQAAAKEKDRLEAIEKAKQEAQAQLASKKAEYQKREAEARAKAEAEAKARREFEEQARKESEIRAKTAAEARAGAEAKAKKAAEERSRREAEAAKRETEAARREAELKKKLAAAPRAKIPVLPIAIAVIAIACIGGGGWYYYSAGERARAVELTAALDAATKATAELNNAVRAEEAAQKQAAIARAAEEAARKSGDAAALRAATAARQQAEDEAAARARLVQQRETEMKAKQLAVTKARDEADRRARQAKKEPQVVKAEEPKAAPAPKAEEPKQEIVAKAEPAPKPAPKAAPKPEPKPAEAPKVRAPKERLSRSEREALRDEEAARKALAERFAREKSQVASAAPSVPAPSASAPSASAPSTSAPSASAPTARVKKALANHELLFEQASEMEKGGKVAQSVRVYRRAARAGSGKAAKRLGEIYSKGMPGVSRDYQESLSWYEKARQLGEEVETSGAR